MRPVRSNTRRAPEKRRVVETLTQGTSTDIEWPAVCNFSFVHNGYITWKPPVITPPPFFFCLRQFPSVRARHVYNKEEIPTPSVPTYTSIWQSTFWARFLGHFHPHYNKLSRAFQSCGSHSGVVEDPVLLGHEAASPGNRIQRFRENITPSSLRVWRFEETSFSTDSALNMWTWSERFLSFTIPTPWKRRLKWPRALRRRTAAACLLGLRVRIPPEAWTSVSCECCMLSGRGLCDGVISHPEESYRMWCV
jgi:hypothetical protein